MVLLRLAEDVVKEEQARLQRPAEVAGLVAVRHRMETSFPTQTFSVERERQGKGMLVVQPVIIQVIRWLLAEAAVLALLVEVEAVRKRQVLVASEFKTLLQEPRSITLAEVAVEEAQVAHIRQAPEQVEMEAVVPVDMAGRAIQHRQILEAVVAAAVVLVQEQAEMAALEL